MRRDPTTAPRRPACAVHLVPTNLSVNGNRLLHSDIIRGKSAIPSSRIVANRPNRAYSLARFHELKLHDRIHTKSANGVSAGLRPPPALPPPAKTGKLSITQSGSGSYAAGIFFFAWLRSSHPECPIFSQEIVPHGRRQSLFGAKQEHKKRNCERASNRKTARLANHSLTLLNSPGQSRFSHCPSVPPAYLQGVQVIVISTDLTILNNLLNTNNNHPQHSDQQPQFDPRNAANAPERIAQNKPERRWQVRQCVCRRNCK